MKQVCGWASLLILLRKMCQWDHLWEPAMTFSATFEEPGWVQEGCIRLWRGRLNSSQPFLMFAEKSCFRTYETRKFSGLFLKLFRESDARLSPFFCLGVATFFFGCMW